MDGTHKALRLRMSTLLRHFTIIEVLYCRLDIHILIFHAVALRFAAQSAWVQLLSVILAFVLSAVHAGTQQFPLPPNYDAILKSPINSYITISYKNPNAKACATAFDTQNQFSGYVNLPPFSLAPYQQNYTINTFFRFFASRTSPETVPLTIWLSSGPGSSSMVGLFEEAGPCEIVQPPYGSHSTQPRLWGWDRSSNLLFIDQPSQTGFSDDERVNASVDLSKDYPFLLDSRQEPRPHSLSILAWLVVNDTFASGRDSLLSAFLQYNPRIHANRTTVESAGLNLFAESYGGMYGAMFANLFEDQDDRRSNGSLPNSALEFRIDSVGIINVDVDLLIELVSIVNFTRNNTYVIIAIDSMTYENAISAFNSHTDCGSLISHCRNQTQMFDPDGADLNKDTNELCAAALYACEKVPDSSSRGNKVHAGPLSLYWIREVLNTCSQEERNAIEQGQGIVSNGVWALAPLTVPEIYTRSSSRSPLAEPKSTTTVQLTGVFTATATPTSLTKSTSDASSKTPFRLQLRAIPQIITWNEEIPKSARRSQRIRTGLIGGLAVSGGLLFVILATSLLARSCRRRTKNALRPDNDSEKVPTIVSRVQEQTFVPSHWSSMMESAPEDGPRPSQNISKMLLLRALPNSCIILGETSLPEPVLYGTQNRTQSDQSISHTQVPAASLKDFPVLVPIERSVSPEEAHTIVMATIPSNEPVSPAIPRDVPIPSEVDSSPVLVQLSISLPFGQLRSGPTSLVESGVGSEVEPTSHKPSLVECIFGCLSDKPVPADVDTPVEGRELTPPPRAATLPRLSRAQTAAIPRKAAEV